MQVSAILNIVYFMSVHCIIYNIKHNPPNVKEKSGNFVFIKILRRVSQDKRIIEHNRTKLYTLQQDRKQVSKNQNVFSAWLTEPHSQ